MRDALFYISEYFSNEALYFVDPDRSALQHLRVDNHLNIVTVCCSQRGYGVNPFAK
jgi:hypothetical protein